jgi:uncharacterized protein
MSEQDNVQKLQELYAAFGRGDIGSILANVSDDCDWGTDSAATEIPWYPIRHGREGVADFFSTLAREVDFQKFQPTIFAGAGDAVIVNVDLDYRFRKNGRSAAVTSLHRFKIRDGVVTSFRAFEDTAAVRAAWGS